MRAHEHVRDFITLSECYDLLNKDLFGDRLPGCVLTFEDKGQCFGHYKYLGYVTRDGNERKDEICLNPRHFLTNTGDLELLQTLAHEMCHQWQYHHGTTSRAGYHNTEWGRQMESIGLIPSSTGRPGGKKTGQSMADYADPDGLFMKVASKILGKRELIRYYKREVFASKIQSIVIEAEAAEDWEEAATNFTATETANAGALPIPKPPSKLKYTCPECQAKAWGKPGLKLVCGTCWYPSAPVYLETS